MLHTRTAMLAAAALLLPLTAYAQAPAPAAPAAAAPAAAAPAPTPGPGAAGFKPLPTTGAANIVDTLKGSGQFNTLVKALDATNLTGVVNGSPRTLIAPTDAAFAQLPAGQVDDLMKPENAAKLQGLLVYHLVALKVTKDQVAGHKGPIPSAAQKPIEADGSADPLKFNDAVVIQAEVPASNGAIYVVDKVLTPPA